MVSKNYAIHCVLCCVTNAPGTSGHSDAKVQRFGVRDNYTAWRRRLIVVLDDLDLWDIANGNKAKPIPADANNV